MQRLAELTKTLSTQTKVLATLIKLKLKATNQGFSYMTVCNVKDDYKLELKVCISVHTYIIYNRKRMKAPDITRESFKIPRSI